MIGQAGEGKETQPNPRINADNAPSLGDAEKEGWHGLPPGQAQRVAAHQYE